MRAFLMGMVGAGVLSVAAAASAGNRIEGEYLEARTCDVYTGPCFANAEMDLSGKKAVMAWKVDKGSWDGVDLAGLSAALVVKAENTLGYDGIFPMKAGKVASVILVDEQASARQREALVKFVKDNGNKQLVGNVVAVHASPIELKNDHLDGVGRFAAGDVAEIRTRALRKGDCVCTNETVYYQPLSNVENFSPAYSETLSFQGQGLNTQFKSHGIRSAFLATFRY